MRTDGELRADYEASRREAWRRADAATEPGERSAAMKIVDAATQDCLEVEGMIRRRGMGPFAKLWDFLRHGA